VIRIKVNTDFATINRLWDNILDKNSVCGLGDGLKGSRFIGSEFDFPVTLLQKNQWKWNKA
jgi:hypothetical protein